MEESNMKKIVSLLLSFSLLLTLTLTMTVSAEGPLTLTVADNESSFDTYGVARFVDGDAKADGVRMIYLVHPTDPNEDTIHNSGAYVLFNSSKAGKVKAIFTLQCPDRVNGAAGYFLDYKVNDGEYNSLDLDNYNSGYDISELNDFELEIEVEKGVNKVYFNQRTANFAGGWRVNVSKIVLSPLDGQTLTAEEVDKSVAISPTGLTKLGGGNVKSIISPCQTEPTSHEAAVGGLSFGHLNSGAGMVFDIDVQVKGTYQITFTVACSHEGPSGKLDIYVDDVKKDTFSNDKATGGWQNWEVSDNTVELELDKGKHTLKFVVPEDGSGMNILVYDITPVNVENPQTGDFGIFTLMFAASAAAAIARKKRK
jgi:hypothetical protein